MKIFIGVPTISGAYIVVNVDHIVFIGENEDKHCELVLSISSKKDPYPIELKWSLVEFQHALAERIKQGR